MQTLFHKFFFFFVVEKEVNFSFNSSVADPDSMGPLDPDSDPNPGGQK
jgi:hypothetical protein